MIIRKILSLLPNYWQSELKRFRYRRQILNNKFLTFEEEYKLLPKLISPGDWVIDIGANVGDYTKRFSELVGESGRVIAFEPVPETFSLLAANTQLFAYQNVSLFNAAASNRMGIASMYIPNSDGLPNYYQATISDKSKDMDVLTLFIDSLEICYRVSLIKIDVEGHEVPVIKGMMHLLENYHPTLIIETNLDELSDWMASLGYKVERFSGSPNILCTYVNTLTTQGT